MPTPENQRRRRAKRATLGEAGKAFIEFVNTGKARYLARTFDASVSATQEDVFQAVRREMDRLEASGFNPPQDWGATVLALSIETPVEPPLPDVTGVPNSGSPETLRAEIRSLQARIGVLDLRITDATLVALCRTIFEAFLINPRFAGHQVFGRCRQCREWFTERTSHQTYCSESCRRAAKYDAVRKSRSPLARKSGPSTA